MEGSGDYGRLLHISPSYASVFAGTALESLYVGHLDEISALLLRPILAWVLSWKYGGTFVAPNVILTVDSFDSYTNFVWFKGGEDGAAKSVVSQARIP